MIHLPLLWLALASPTPPSVESMFSKGVQPVQTGLEWSPDALEGLSAETCKDCHEAIYDEWRQSRHHLSWTNGIFQVEYRQQPRAWCVNCHAPLQAQVAQVAAGGGALANEGVNCVTCHVRGGKMLATKRSPDSIHETVAVPGFDGAAYCAGCHQFNFPVFDEVGNAVRFTGHPMQRTVAQFEAGPYARGAEGCHQCHRSASGHLYPGAHHPEMLARALELVFCRPAPGRLRVGVRNKGAGHNVPTGDIHRHMNARVWRSTAPEAMFEVFIGRRFELAPDGGKKATWDSTLPPGKLRQFDFDEVRLGGSADEPINVELRYVYTVDEWPRRGHDPGEPMSQKVSGGRMSPREVPVCAEAVEGAQ